jgi:histone-lysine N-methyltransferase SETMAR
MSKIACDSLNGVEYRSVIRFLLLLGKDNREILEQLQAAYKEKCPSNVTVYFWINEFKRGRQTVEDEPRSGRPADVKNEEMIERCEEIISENRRITVEELSAILHISTGSAHAIVHELGFNKVSSRFVPRFLTPEMREDRVSCCEANLKLYDQYGEKFLHNIVTVDETPLSLYIPESKR